MSICLLHVADISLIQPLDPLVVEVKEKIKALEIQFKILRRSTREVLQYRGVGGMQIEVDPTLDIKFVEKPPDDIFCPVTATPLLLPHLTSCCGQHLSEEVADRIKRDGGACPLCNKPSWFTLRNKHFQRTVRELRVFCPHRMRGCRWEGELGALHRHKQSCASKTSSLETHSQVSNQEQIYHMHIPHCTHVCATSLHPSSYSVDLHV